MKTIELKAWSEFPKTVQDIASQYGTHKLGEHELANRILFRGQVDAELHLETTLERFSRRDWAVRIYAELANRCGPEVESFTDRDWGLLSWDELAEWFEGYDPIYKGLPDYSFWIYLRQHGFPSPLLDWTASPYLAAFFAVSERVDAERAAVFAYIETPEGSKGGFVGSKAISVQGPYIRSHRRHFLQQSWYTICTELTNGGYYFSCHEDVFAKGSTHQDLLIKITLPRCERLAILSELRKMNITEFSLFQTEEALMKTLALEKIEKCEP